MGQLIAFSAKLTRFTPDQIVGLIASASVMIVLALTACVPSASKATGPGANSGLPPDTEWSDPENFLPKGRAADEPTLADALVNKKAGLIAIRGGTVMTAAGTIYSPGMVVLEGGSIRSVGKLGATPAGAHVIDATGQVITPGIIDAHSHLGVYANPQVRAHSDGNEVVGPVTAFARAEYGYWPGDPAITRARAGGVTTALVLPGSANLIGGRGTTVIMRPGASGNQVRFPGAPATLKMACGENPKRVYGEKGGPMTRMSEYAKFREAFHKAADYRAKKERYKLARQKWEKRRDMASTYKGKKKDKMPKAEPAPEPVPADLGLETLAGVLAGDVLVQIHCYRSDDLYQMMKIADEFGFSIRSFHHALEAYKIRDQIIERGIAISTWADWWGFKMEAFDGITQNAAMFTASGGRAVIHSDSAIGIQRLNQEASKAMWAGRHVGIKITDDQALRWVTANPAWVLGLDKVIGTLESGKRADVVIWNRSPLSVYSQAQTVIQAGEIVYQRKRGLVPSDFELSNSSLQSSPQAALKETH